MITQTTSKPDRPRYCCCRCLRPVPAQQYNNLEAQYRQLNRRTCRPRLRSGQVHITRLQGAIKVAVNGRLLFPSGGWQMPPAAAKTIAEMGSVLAPMQTAHVTVIGYTDSTPIWSRTPAGSRHRRQQLSLEAGADRDADIISQGVKRNLLTAQGHGGTSPVAPNDTPQGRAQNRRVELTLSNS